jgi:DNA end-binding protein Ku
MRGKEYLCAVKPSGDGLLLETLYYADEIKDSEPLFSTIEDAKAEDELLDVAAQLIERKTAPFRPEAFKDHYDLALRALIEAKRKNRKTPRAQLGGGERPKGGNVVDLMEALKDSLKESKPGGKAPAKKKSA